MQLEQRGSSQVAWLRVVSHSIWTDHHELEAVLSVLRQALRRKRPFLVIWDVRSLTFPRVNMAQVQQVRDFTYEFAEAFDRHVQAHAIILKNPLVIAFAHILLRFFQPPQPYKIVKDDASATEFASTCCLSPRSFVKASYDTEAEFRLGSLLG